MSEVDVSKCRYYNKPFCDLYDNYCSDCDICYYKLKEQKLEKIKEIAKDIVENDCYENSDIKAERILQIIESEEE